MKKIVFIQALLALSCFAKELPIVESLAIDVSDQKAIIDFPFEIQSISAEEFVPAQGQTASRTPEIKKGKNVLELSSGASGTLKTVIWGYDHPIFLEIHFDKSGDKYYKFTDPSLKESAIKDFETNSHEDVLADLVIAAYNEKIPSGYSTTSKTLKGVSENLEYELSIEYSGGQYAVQTWKIKNISEKEIELYEEMFASDANKVYAISIEATRLKSNEKTRVFVVKQASKTYL